MPYVVTQSCCADASCVIACPVNCIHPTPDEPGFGTTEMLYVDGTSCVDCGACASACPVDAIKPHTKLTPAEQPFVQINADYYDCFPHRDRAPLAHVAAQRRIRRPGRFRVAVVGAGPAGLYTADELLKHPEISVDVLDRLPTPYGLVRAGVAPDHPHTKRVERLFAQIEQQPRFGYLLGVDVGRDLTLDELRVRYDAVVYATGAAADRPLGVPGEDLPGSLAATDVVAWYNGRPDAQDLDIDLAAGERAVVVGNGNVALDVARILTADPDALERTDIAALPWAALTRSRIREVVVLGRRGPAQAAFTLPELVGLSGLPGSVDVDVVVEGVGPDQIAGTDHRSRLLRELAARTRTPGRRAVVLRFLVSPLRILGEDHVTGVEVGRNRLEVHGGAPLAVPTGESEVLEASLVVRAVGYRGLPVADLPHDEATGVVPNHRGRVRSERPGLYVAGWVKRGPTGFIGSNKSDAEDTVATLLDDLDAGRLPPPSEGVSSVLALLVERGVAVVDLAGWRALDAEERRRGAERGRPRAKIVAVPEMLRIAATARRRGVGRVSRRRYASLSAGDPTGGSKGRSTTRR